MATIDDMIEMVNTLEDEKKGWSARTIWGKPGRFPGSLVKSIMWQALRHAEEDGLSYNEMHGNNEWCTYWRVGNYLVSYVTDNEYLNSEMLPVNAEMLTKEMMDDLIIEEA